MYLLDFSFFTGNIHIPNLQENCFKDYSFYKLLSKWEKEGLELILGKNLSDELISQFEITGEEGSKKMQLKSNVDQKWKFLIDGRKYQKDDEFVSRYFQLSNYGCGCKVSNLPYHVWDGLIQKQTIIIDGKEATFKESLLAYYVYYRWTFDNASVTTGVGEQLLNAKNSSNVSNIHKRVSAFNYFFSLVRYCGDTGKVGLQLFLKEHAELFPSFVEIQFENQNIYGV